MMTYVENQLDCGMWVTSFEAFLYAAMDVVVVVVVGGGGANNVDHPHGVHNHNLLTSYCLCFVFTQCVAAALEATKKMSPTERDTRDAKYIQLLKRSIQGLVCQFPLKFLELDPTLIVSSNLKASIADFVSAGAFFT